MINLISFYYDENFKYKQKEALPSIISSLKKHIDNLETNGWNSTQLIIKTNFEFNYRGIYSELFQFKNTLNSLFLTKIIAAYEVLKQFPDEIVWSHDHDTYQIKPFNQKKIKKIIKNTDIMLCNYWPGSNTPQGASVFYNQMSETLVDMYNTIKYINSAKITDEILFSWFKHKQYNIQFNLPYEYNTSLTKYTCDKRFSNNPICVHGDLNRKFDTRKYKKYTNQI
jgi:hypothetical protein